MSRKTDKQVETGQEPGIAPTRYWHTLDDNRVMCDLCPRACKLHEGQRGLCFIRANHGGQIVLTSYGRSSGFCVDPIEKKPLYHFLPGREAFSMSTAGCPLSCKFCQNWEISQSRPEDYESEYISPQRIVVNAAAHSTPIIAYTYNEPTVFIEYLTDIARLARERGLRTAMISCGFMNEAPLDELIACLDALKIDLKGFSRDFYRNVCHAELDPVLRSIRQAARSGIHLELVNLVVPTLNDSPAMLAGLCRWVADELGPDVPIHFTRFHPDYQLQNLPPTPRHCPPLPRPRSRPPALREPLLRLPPSPIVQPPCRTYAARRPRRPSRPQQARAGSRTRPAQGSGRRP